MKKDNQLAAGLRAQSKRAIADMVALAQTEGGIPIEASAFDHDPDLINTPTGNVDLITGKLRPHDPERLHMKCTAVGPDFDMPTPRFDAFMQEVFSHNEAVIDFMTAWLGYCLSGRTSEEKLLFLMGAGANGKSVLMKLLLALMGDYATSVAMSSLMQQRPGAIRNDLAALQGVRLAVANEGNRGDVMDTAIVKGLTSGDPLTVRRLYGEPFTYTPSAKFIIASNHRPQVDGDDSAIWRRFEVVPFQRQFQPHEQDQRLFEKLLAEGPGILAKLIQGAVRWYAEGLVVPEVLKAATAEYRKDMDIVQSFIDDCCVLAANAETMASQLYREFVRYAREAGVVVPSQTEFGRSLASRGIVSRKSSVVYRVGIGLRPANQDGRPVA